MWQANSEGYYDVQQKDIQPDMNLRGRFVTGADGRTVPATLAGYGVVWELMRNEKGAEKAEWRIVADEPRCRAHATALLLVC